MFRRLLIVALLLLMPSPVKAQGAYYQLAPAAPGTIINGVQTRIYVCPLPDGGFPCPFPTSIYSNSTLTTPLSNPAVLTTSGQFAFWTTPGQYTVQITAPYNIRMVVNIDGRGASGISTPITPPNPTIFNVDTQFAGPDFDIRNYGARWVFTNLNSFVNGTGPTINIPTNSTSGTLSSAPSRVSALYVNDWLYIPGAGAVQSMTTPSAPTVTPSVAVGETGTYQVQNTPAASTSYCYEIVWIDQGGGYTAASPAGCTSTGQPTLGLQSLTLTGATLSNNVVTFTTAARSPEILTAGQLVMLQTTGYGQSYVNINSVPNNTSFTVVQGSDSRNGGYVTSALFTGSPAEVVWWNLNRITFPTAPSSAWEALIYGRTSGSYTLLGVSFPAQSVIGNYWDDYGSTMEASPTVPLWAPSSPPSSAVNDALSSQITAISGTSVTLHTASGSGSGYCGTGTCSAAMVLLDDGPAIVAAAKAAVSLSTYAGGIVYIPSSFAPGPAGYPVQSYTDISSSTIGASVQVIQNGGLDLNGTISINGVKWDGDVLTGPVGIGAWGVNIGAEIGVGHAYPAFFSSGNIHISGIQIGNPANLYNDFFIEGSIPTGFMRNFGISGGGSSDMMGIPIIFAAGFTAGNSAILLRDFSVSTGPNQVTSTSTPLIWNFNFGEFTMENFYLNRRGYFENVSCLAPNTFKAEQNFERQGGITPMFAFQPECNGSGIDAKIHNTIQDTESVAMIADLSGPGGNGLQLTLGLDALGGVSGSPAAFINVPNDATTPSGTGGYQNDNYEAFNIGVAGDGIFNGSTSKKNFGTLLSVGPAYSTFVEAQTPAVPVLSTPTSGGSLAYVNTGYTITIAPVFDEAGRLAEGMPSPASNSETVSSTCPKSGNCTIPASWTAVPNALGYNVYVNGVALTNNWPTSPDVTVTSINIGNRGSRGGNYFSAGGPVGMNVNGMWSPYIDLPQQASAPSNPPSGGISTCRFYYNSSGVVAGVNSSGSSCGGGTTQTIASGTASLGTSAISSGTCASVVTVSATGVLTTDNIQADFNANPTSTLGYEPGAMLTIIKYPTAGNVNFLVCNNTANSITPGAVTLNWRVVR